MKKLLWLLLFVASLSAAQSFNGGTVGGNILPDTTGRDLGSSTQQWDAFIQNLTIYGNLTGVLGSSGPMDHGTNMTSFNPVFTVDVSADTNLKQGVYVNSKKKTAWSGTGYVSGIYVDHYTPADNGGESSGLYVHDSGGGNAATFVHLSAERPASYANTGVAAGFGLEIIADHGYGAQIEGRDNSVDSQTFGNSLFNFVMRATGASARAIQIQPASPNTANANQDAIWVTSEDNLTDYFRMKLDGTATFSNNAFFATTKAANFNMTSGSTGYISGNTTYLDVRMGSSGARFLKNSDNSVLASMDNAGKGTFAGGVNPTTYNAGGTQQTGVHVVIGQCTLGTNCSVSLTGSAAFTNATSYACSVVDETGIFAAKLAKTNGTAITITGNATDVIDYVCIGN